MSECKCSLRGRLVGDGCEVCNPAQALEYAKERITELERDCARWVSAQAVWAAEDKVRREKIEQLERALRDMESMYSYVWDRADGALVCFPDNIGRFEEAHAEARKVLGLHEQP